MASTHPNTACIVVVGNELLNGDCIDTNSHYLQNQLQRLRITIEQVSVLPDHREHIIHELQRCTPTHDYIFIAGGLGSTEDDVTREAVALAFKRPLLFDDKLFVQLKESYRTRKQPLSDNIRKQCLFPEGAVPLKNSIGTAQAFYLHEGAHVFVFPGVPSELASIYEKEVERRLEGQLGVREHKKLTVKTLGISESALDERVRSIALHHRVRWETCATHQGVFLKLYPQDPEHLTQEAPWYTALQQDLHKDLGASIYAYQEEDLVGLLRNLLNKKSLSIGVMESCTGGLLAKILTDSPGSSRFFKGGLVSYSNAVKVSFGVPEDLIKRFGSVSEEVAVSMAKATQKLLNVDVALATTGIAGPDGGSAGKPVGLVYSALACVEGKVQVWRSVFRGSRDDVRQSACYFTLYCALNHVRL